MNYYPHHIGDFNNATRHLTRIERSIYRDLIELYYDTEKPLPHDQTILCRRILARTDEEVAAVNIVLSEFFTDATEGWVHDRCQREINAYHAKADKAKESAAKRWNKPADANAMPSHSVGNPNQNQEPKPEPKPRTRIQEPKTKEPDTALENRRAVLQSYCTAYADRYGVAPLQNAKTNSLIKRFSELVPAEEAPAVAAYFVGHNGQFYVAKMHPLELLVADAGKLRTEWATGSAMTATRARQTDRTGSMLSIVEELKRERGEA